MTDTTKATTDKPNFLPLIATVGVGLGVGACALISPFIPLGGMIAAAIYVGINETRAARS